MHARIRLAKKMAIRVGVLMLLPACVVQPVNRQNQESTTAIQMNGYAGQAGDTVSFTATNLTNGGTSSFPPTTAVSTPTNSGAYSGYGWGMSLTPPADFWAPQQAWNGLKTGPGRLEITAYDQALGGAMYTFSFTARQCINTKYSQGVDLFTAGFECSDGRSIVAFDNDGVGNLAETQGWTKQYGPFTDVANGDTITWEVGSYPVQGKTIWGVMCHPSGNAPASGHRAVVINHGGYDGIDETQFGLPLCTAFAHRGWLAAMSSYRGEWVHLPTVVSPPLPPLLSGGTIEFCQGEVIDSLRLVDIVRGLPDVNQSKVLMWGHSHGGCVTQRAVEQGAPVAAAAAFDGPSDLKSWEASVSVPALGCVLGQGVNFNSPLFSAAALNGCSAANLADPATAPMAYSWRSSALVASDLKAATATIPFLIVHGAGDTWVPVEQACELAYNAFGAAGTYWHYNLSASLTSAVPVSACTGTCTQDCNQLTFTQPPATYKPGGYLAVYDNPQDNPPNYAHLQILDPNGKPWNDFLAFTDAVIPQ